MQKKIKNNIRSILLKTLIIIASISAIIFIRDELVKRGVSIMMFTRKDYMNAAEYYMQQKYDEKFESEYIYEGSVYIHPKSNPYWHVVVDIENKDGMTYFHDNYVGYLKKAELDGKLFEIYKFRTMREDAEKDGIARLAGEDDDRITAVGKLLRATRFDELPQLFNIIKGEMSLVGPRPERPEIAAEYMEELPEFSMRLKMKAGLTGYAQVHGKYNTTPYDKLKLDLHYIRNYSIWMDLILIVLTPKVLFMKESTEGVGEGEITANTKDK